MRGRKARIRRTGVLGAAGALLLASAIVVTVVRRDAQPARTGPPAGVDEPAIVTDLRDRARAALEEEGVPVEETARALAAFDRGLRPASAAGRASVASAVDGEALRRAVQALQEPFADRPLPRAALQHAVAESWAAFGLHAPGVSLERDALATRRRLLGDDHPKTLASLGNLGGLLNAAGMLDEALPILRESVERNRRVLGGDSAETLGALNNMAAALWRKDRYDEAQDLLTEALEGCRRVFGSQHPFTLSTASNLGVLLTEAGRYEEALPFCREALDGRLRALGDDHPLTLQSMDSTILVLRSMRRLDDAIALCREAVDRRVRVHGEEHPRTLVTTTTLGTLLFDGGAAAEAVAVLAPAEDAARRTLTGPERRHLGIFLAALGRARARTGEFDEALADLTDARIVLDDPSIATTSDVTYALTGLVELLETWHAADPAGGHDRRAATWRAELEGLGGGGAAAEDR